MTTTLVEQQKKKQQQTIKSSPAEDVQARATVDRKTTTPKRQPAPEAPGLWEEDTPHGCLRKDLYCHLMSKRTDCGLLVQVARPSRLHPGGRGRNRAECYLPYRCSMEYVGGIKQYSAAASRLTST